MKQKGIGTVMAEKTQVYHFAPGMPYIPPKDFRLVRAKWESPQLYINGLPAFSICTCKEKMGIILMLRYSVALL